METDLIDAFPTTRKSGLSSGNIQKILTENLLLIRLCSQRKRWSWKKSAPGFVS